MNAIQEWRGRYRVADLDAIPLRANGKRPLCGRWQELAPDAQWEAARGYGDLNIGVLPGRGRVVIDTDSRDAADLVDKRLQDMGLVVPRVATATPGHAQFYLSLDGVPDGYTYQKLDAAIGPGEFRAGPGAQVVAPPSVIGGREYVFVRGAPEDLPRLKVATFNDCLWLVPPPAHQTVICYELEQTPLLRWPVSKETQLLLLALQTATRGAPIAGYRYRSVSEAELAAVVRLVCAGRQLGEVAAIFDTYQPTHYASHQTQKSRRDYLALTYQTARRYFYEHPQRRELAALHNAALTWPWPGRTGATDRAVYLAAVRVAYQLGRAEVNLPARTLATIAAVDRDTVSAALRRMAHLLAPVSAGTCRTGARYRIALETRLRASGEVLGVSGASDYAELWTPGRLGKTAGVVFDALTEAPRSTADLTDATGQGRRTVERALTRLQDAGLATRSADGWTCGWRDLADVAASYDVAGTAYTRRQEYRRERSVHQALHTDCNGGCAPS